MSRTPVTIGLAGAGAGLAAVAAAGVVAQRRLARAIAEDPHSDELRDPVRGEPGSARSADGTEIHVERFGVGDGPAVVLLHGWTEAIAYWTPVIRELVDRDIRVFACDLRGHGASGRAPGGDYGMPRFGEDVEAVLASFVPEGGAVVVGHSLGAMSIAAWAEHHDVPRRAAAVALMNTGVGNLVADSLLVPLPKIAHAVRQSIAVRGFLGSRAPLPRFSTPVSHAVIRYAAFGPTATPAQVAFYERMLLATPPDVRADAGIAMSEMDLYDALANLTVPTAVFAGAKDRLTPPSHAERMAEMLPQLHSLTVLDGIGHMGALEATAETVAKITELVALARERSAVAA